MNSNPIRSQELHRPLADRGITTMEVLIAGFIGAIILLAAFTIYLQSIESWDLAGARLALQRNGDRVVRQIAFEIRHGDAVAVGADSTSIAVTRTAGGATATLVSYSFDAANGRVLRDGSTVLAEDVTSLRFRSSSNGAKVWISMTLEDDLDTDAITLDDQRVEINSVAVCRNEAY
jgi:Tfp pilus assembly protein PilV